LLIRNLLKKARRIGQVHEIDVSPQGILITDALLPQEMEEYKSIMNSLLKKRGGGQAGTHYNDSSAVRDAFSKLLEYIEGRCTCIQAFLHANADAALMADIGGQYIVEQTNLYFYFANRFVEMFFGGVHQLKCGETTVDSCTAIEGKINKDICIDWQCDKRFVFAVSADITKKFETNDARRKKNKPHDEEQNEAEESKSREASDGMGGASLQQVPSVPVPSVDQTPQPTTSPPATADTTTTTMNPFVANYGLA
jgi:hypothetical protein